MAILKTITTTSTIVDADGVNAFGWLRVRPNAPFEYNDGSNNISVTDAIIECQIQNGAIYAVGGVVGADLELAPNTGASNSPETYYIADLELNGSSSRQYWRIASSTGGAGSVDVEYVDIPRVPGPDTGSSDTMAAHLAASNPHPQYVLRSDTVASGGTTTGSASDGLGKIPRVNTSTGKFDTSVIPSGATITAATVTLADAGTYFTTDNVEAALQEIASTSTAFISTARIQADAVTNAKLANMATQTIKGRNTAGTGDPEDLTASQAAGIVRSNLIEDAINNGETSKAPTSNAVFDALALKVAHADLLTEDIQIIFGGAGNVQVGPLTNASTRKYISYSVTAVSAGATADFSHGRFEFSSGSGGYPNYFRGYYTGAGATVDVRLYYIAA